MQTLLELRGACSVAAIRDSMTQKTLLVKLHAVLMEID